MANVNKVKRSPVFISLDKDRQLKYTLNAFAEMEERYGSVDEAVKAMEKGSIKAIRFMLWAGLIHEDKSLTEEQVGDLIDIADMQEIADKMNLTMSGDLPQREEASDPNVVSPTPAV